MNTKIAEYRARRGITQVQLAQEVGVTQTTISQHETGLTTPSVQVLVKIAKALDVTVDALLEDEVKTS